MAPSGRKLTEDDYEDFKAHGRPYFKKKPLLYCIVDFGDELEDFVLEGSNDGHMEEDAIGRIEELQKSRKRNVKSISFYQNISPCGKCCHKIIQVAKSFGCSFRIRCSALLKQYHEDNWQAFLDLLRSDVTLRMFQEADWEVLSRAIFTDKKLRYDKQMKKWDDIWKFRLDPFFKALHLIEVQENITEDNPPTLEDLEMEKEIRGKFPPWIEDKYKLTEKKEDPDSYSVNHFRRGTAYIFSHETFEEGTGLISKQRNSMDRDRLEKLLERLEFNVKVHNDLSKKELLKTLSEASRDYEDDTDCLLVAVLTQGDETELYAKDGKYDIEELWRPFIDKKCPNLARKPKIFLIQACQEETTLATIPGVAEARSNNDKSPPSSADQDDIYSRTRRLNEAVLTEKQPLLEEERKIDHFEPKIVNKPTENKEKRKLGLNASEADFLFIFHSQKGQVTGVSPFIQIFCQEVEEGADDYDFLTLMTFVMGRFTRNVTNACSIQDKVAGPESGQTAGTTEKQKSQIPLIQSYLTRKVYFREK